MAFDYNFGPEATARKSLKHLSMLKSTRALISVVAADPLTVAERLFERELVAQEQVRDAQLATKHNHLKASELVIHLIDMVGSFPQKYDEILDVLREFPWLKNGVKRVEETHKAEEAALSRYSDSASVSTLVHLQYIGITS